MDWFLGIHALMLLKLPVSVVMVGANLQEPKIVGQEAFRKGATDS